MVRGIYSRIGNHSFALRMELENMVPIEYMDIKISLANGYLIIF